MGFLAVILFLNSIGIGIYAAYQSGFKYGQEGDKTRKDPTKIGMELTFGIIVGISVGALICVYRL